MLASADAQNSVYDTSPVAVVLSEATDVSSDEELLPPQAPNTSNATSGKLRLIVLRMESNRWLVTFIPAKLVDSQCLSKSGLAISFAVHLFPGPGGILHSGLNSRGIQTGKSPIFTSQARWHLNAN